MLLATWYVMGIPSKLVDFLNQGKVRYEILHHPEAFTSQELTAIEHVRGKYHAKVVMAKADGGPVMTVLPANQRVDFKALDRVTGKRTALATEAEFKAGFPDCAVGTMPPFGNLYGIETYVEERLAQNDYIVFEAGTHTDAIKMSYADYARLATPIVAEFAVKLY